MTEPTPDLTLLMRLVEQGIEETRALRRENISLRNDVRDVRTIVRNLIDQGPRLRDDLELLIRGELMGRTAHMETTFENADADRRAVYDRRLDAIEAELARLAAR